MKKNVSFGKALLKYAVPVAAALVLVIGGISVSGFMNGNGQSASEPAVYAAKTRSSVDYDMDGVYYDAPAEYAYSEEMAVAAEAADMLYGTSSSGSSNGTDLWNPSAQSDQARKLVRTASLTIRTSAFEDGLNELKAMVASMGGYLEDFSQTGDDTSLRRASFTIRIPVDRLDEFLGGAGSMGRVTERYESAYDMTSQYYDNETRLNTLRAKLARLTEMMATATKMSDIIEIENAISETQYQIDSYETSQRTIDNQVDMATVNLTLREEKKEEVAKDEKITFGERVGAAFVSGFSAFGSFLGNMLVFLAIALPFLVLIAAVVFAAVMIVRARGKKKACKENEKDGPDEIA